MQSETHEMYTIQSTTINNHKVKKINAHIYTKIWPNLNSILKHV